MTTAAISTFRLTDPASTGPGRTARTDARPDGAAALQIDLVRECDGLALLASEWNALFEHAGRPGQVFQTHAFAMQFVAAYDLCHRHQASETPCACRLAILTARRSGRLVLVWPLVETRRFGLRHLGWLGEPVAQYGDVLLDPAEPVVQTLSAAYDHLRVRLSPDVVRLRKVRADAAIAPFLSTLGIATTEHAEAPLVTLRAGGSAFEDRQSGKAKKNRRRLRRRLEELGSVAFREIPATDDATLAITTALFDKRDWLQRRGLVAPALADRRIDKFLIAAAADPTRQTGCSVFELTLDGRQIALALGFRCRSRLMLHLITYAADIEKYGAGVLNLEAILRLAENEGLDAVDLLPPKAEYKLDWADCTIAVADHVGPVSVRGWLMSPLIERIAIPATKRVLERLPLALRQRIASRTLRDDDATLN
jgi:CelD/BcsL family acetyltransferase involved in cellulose biosynthesis